MRRRGFCDEVCACAKVRLEESSFSPLLGSVLVGTPLPFVYELGGAQGAGAECGSWGGRTSRGGGVRGGAREHRGEGWGGGAWGAGTQGRPGGSGEGRRLRSGERGEWKRGVESRLSRPSLPGVKCRDLRMPCQPGGASWQVDVVSGKRTLLLPSAFPSL